MKYNNEFNERGGRRVDWIEPPSPGTRFLNQFGDEVTFDEIGLAGMLACSDSEGSQSLYLPEHLRILEEPK